MHLKRSVLARLISPRVINLSIDLLTEANNLLLVYLPHLAVQVNKFGVMNLLVKLLTEVNYHLKTYQGLMISHAAAVLSSSTCIKMLQLLSAGMATCNTVMQTNMELQNVMSSGSFMECSLCCWLHKNCSCRIS